MYKKIIKRVLDIVFSLLLLPFVIVVLIIMGLIIYFNDKGPIFYNAPRLGYKGKTFKMYKLRSMKVDAPDIRNEDGSTFNSENDPRVTTIGKLIRKTSVDELPQLFNVLKGDMSFVGPRPDLPESINFYEEYELNRLEVLPGITGYSQAFVRNSVSWKERIKNDLYYTENIAFSLDYRIIIQTIKTVFNKKNIYANQVNNVDEGF